MNETCKRGHSYEEHGYTRKNGKGRFCAECVKIRRTERAQERAAATPNPAYEATA
jgi:hypothetical protein